MRHLLTINERHNKHVLVPDAVRARLPELQTTQGDRDPIAQLRWIAPWLGWTWYPIEFDGDDTLFGFVRGSDRDFGYFQLAEVESLRGPWGNRVERDIFFRPTPVREIYLAGGRSQQS